MQGVLRKSFAAVLKEINARSIEKVFPEIRKFPQPIHSENLSLVLTDSADFEMFQKACESSLEFVQQIESFSTFVRTLLELKEVFSAFEWKNTQLETDFASEFLNEILEERIGSKHPTELLTNSIDAGLREIDQEVSIGILVLSALTFSCILSTKGGLEFQKSARLTSDQEIEDLYDFLAATSDHIQSWMLTSIKRTTQALECTLRDRQRTRRESTPATSEPADTFEI
jgi:hypothetical protein